jgi:DNA segregation ATPase FtsK/SpoIIIE-like protein
MRACGVHPADTRLVVSTRTPCGWSLVVQLRGAATVERLSDRARNIAVAFQARAVNVEAGHEAHRCRVRIHLSDPLEAVQAANAERVSGGAPLPSRALALTHVGPAIWVPSAAPHVLIVGATGAGKSVAIKQAICSLAADKWDWRFEFVDLKGVTLGPYSDAWRVLASAIEPEPATELVLGLVRLVYDRRKALLKAGVDHWLKDLPAVGGYPVLMVIDELTELLTAHAYGEDQKSAKARLDGLRVALSSVARLGRFVGVHLLVGLQRPDASILGGGELRDNLTARLALGTMSADGLRMVFGAAAAGQAMPSQPGRGLVVGIPPALTSPLECAVPMPSATEFEAALGGRPPRRSVRPHWSG